MQYIGKLNKNKLGKYKYKTITDEVILTEERIKHIKEHHPGDYEKYYKYLTEIIKNPDYIIDDSKNIDTIVFLKTIMESNKNFQVIVRLNTNLKEINKKNSILTLWKINSKAYNQIIRNKQIIWRKLDKTE